jgi:hypothetical protein
MALTGTQCQHFKRHKIITSGKTKSISTRAAVTAQAPNSSQAAALS